jgi:hypothetical protein
MLVTMVVRLRVDVQMLRYAPMYITMVGVLMHVELWRSVT